MAKYNNKDEKIQEYIKLCPLKTRAIYSLSLYKAFYLIKKIDISYIKQKLEENKNKEYRVLYIFLIEYSFFIFFKNLHLLLYDNIKIPKEINDCVVEEIISVFVQIGERCESIIIDLKKQLDVCNKKNKNNFAWKDSIENYANEILLFQSGYANIEIDEAINVLISYTLKLKNKLGDIVDCYSLFLKTYFEDIQGHNIFKLLDFDYEKMLILPYKISFSEIEVSENFTTFIYFKKAFRDGMFVGNKENAITNSLEILIIDKLSQLSYNSKNVKSFFSISNFITFLIFYLEVEETSEGSDRRNKIFSAYFKNNFQDYSEGKDYIKFRDIMADRLNLSIIKIIDRKVKTIINTYQKLFKDSLANEQNSQAQSTQIMSDLFVDGIVDSVDFFVRLEYLQSSQNKNILFPLADKDLTARQKKIISELTTVINDGFKQLR